MSKNGVNRCQWVKLSGGGVTKDQYGMTIVDLNNLGYRDEPFVLAKRIDWSEDYNNFVVIPPFEVNANPYILPDNEDAPYLRRDHNQGTFVKRKSVTVTVPADF